jgi:hypothetical protein
MSSLNSSSYRAPSRSQRIDTAVDYELRQGETSHDTGVYISSDGHRVSRQGINVGLKKRKIAPSDLVDTFGDWVPLPGDADDVRAAAEGEYDLSDEASGTGEKRKCYESSVRIAVICCLSELTTTQDDPMNLWRPLVQRFLDELVRREGLGEEGDECACCRTKFRATKARRFRCKDCGDFIQCNECVLSRHSLAPLHRLEVRVLVPPWNRKTEDVYLGMER